MKTWKTKEHRVQSRFFLPLAFLRLFLSFFCAALSFSATFFARTVFTHARQQREGDRSAELRRVERAEIQRE